MQQNLGLAKKHVFWGGRVFFEKETCFLKILLYSLVYKNKKRVFFRCCVFFNKKQDSKKTFSSQGTLRFDHV